MAGDQHLVSCTSEVRNGYQDLDSVPSVDMIAETMFSTATLAFQAISATCTKRPMRRSCLSGVASHCDLAVPISSLISDNIDSNTSEIVVKSDFFVWQSIYIGVRWDSFDLRVKSGDV